MSTPLPRVTKRSGKYSRIVIGLVAVAACLAVAVGYLVFSRVTNVGQPATAVDRDINQLRAQLAKSPGDPSTLSQLAVMEYQKGRVADALEHGALAVKGAGTTPRIRLEYAGILLPQHKAADAKQLAQAEIDLPSDSTEADAYFIKAQAERDLKDLKGALDSMVAGLRRSPYAADARILYADMLKESGKKQEAINQYQAALLFLPKDPRATAALKDLGVEPSASVGATSAAHPKAPATTTK